MGALVRKLFALGQTSISATPRAPDFVVVLSLERTGSTAIAESLKRGFDPERVIQAHFFDGDAYRPAPPAPGDEGRRADKQAREARVRAWLGDPSLNGVVFSIVRDPVGRIASGLWCKKTDMLVRHYQADTDAFRPTVMKLIDSRMQDFLEKEANYARDVYLPLGLPARPAPGTYRAKNGARVFVLDFARIEDDFRTATQAAFGRVIPLIRAKNGAAAFGDPQIYAAFKRFCAQILAAERLQPG